MTQQVLEKFTVLTDKALRQFLNERINDRLKSALGADMNTVMPVPDEVDEQINEEVQVEEASDGIETTDEELAAYRIVKAIACAELPFERITYRDVRSYFSVLADDNNRRPILRCYFGRRKVIAFVNDDKTEERYNINSVEDIYQYVDKIREAARRWA